MANRYWVGGTGTWDTASTANWSLSSGGAGGASAPISTDAVTFDSASGTGIVTISGAVCSTFTMTAVNASGIVFAFGSSSITCFGSGTTWSAVGTNVTFTGTPTVNISNNSATSSTINNNVGWTETNVFNFNITTGTYSFAATSGAYFRTLNFTGFTGTWSATGIAYFYGSLTLTSSMTFTAGSTWTFSHTSGTAVITSAGNIVNGITINGNGGTLQLADALNTGTRAFNFLAAGTLDLNNFTLTASNFAASAASVRQFKFGTGNITVTKASGTTGTIFSLDCTTVTYTGTPTVNISNNSAIAINMFIATGGPTEANVFNYNITTGTYVLTDSGGNAYKNLNYTGFAGTVANLTKTIYGNLTTSSTMTLGAGANPITFAATSGTQTITTNNKTLNFPLTFGAAGSSATTYAINGALTMGSTRALSFVNGALQFTAGTTNTVGSFTTTGTTLKYLRSSVSGTQATIAKASGATTVTYLNIQDSNATGGTWTATATSNFDAGNNTGWLFGSALTAVVSESLSLQDASESTQNFFNLITEALGLTDSSELITEFASAATENIAIADTPTAGTALVSSILEDLVVADFSLGNTTQNVSINEPQTIQDAATVLVSFIASRTEGLTLDETSAAVFAAAVAITEALTVANAQTAILVFVANINENINLADFSLGNTTQNVSINEPQTIQDAATVIANFSASRTEVITANDNVQGIFAFFAAITEALTVANAQTAILVFVANINENINLADFSLGNTTQYPVITENINLLDAPIGFAWVKIDNTESTQWVLIDNRQ